MPKWFSITALAAASVPTADIVLRGYIGEPKFYDDYWTGQQVRSGGAGTVQEFEDELTALGEVQQLNVYITSEGGDYMQAIAIHNILARQKAKVVCTIDGFAFSAAPVIAMAADEIRIAGNGLMMIHDAEFWSAGSDIKALQDAIATLNACNDSMATAFVGKAGGTMEEWRARMDQTTWLTGAQAKELGLVDVVMDDLALTAFAPLSKITAALPKIPDHVRGLIDKAAVTASPNPDSNPHPEPTMLRPRTPLFSAAETGGVPSTGNPAAVETPAPAAPAATPTAVVEPAAAPATDIAATVAAAVTAAVSPLTAKITALEGDLAHIKGLKDHGITASTTASPAPVEGGATPEGGTPATKPGLGMVSAAWKPARK
jgi:ATP-dependent Clp protease, protease subunit